MFRKKSKGVNQGVKLRIGKRRPWSETLFGGKE